MLTWQFWDDSGFLTGIQPFQGTRRHLPGKIIISETHREKEISLLQRLPSMGKGKLEAVIIGLIFNSLSWGFFSVSEAAEI